MRLQLTRIMFRESFRYELEVAIPEQQHLIEGVST